MGYNIETLLPYISPSEYDNAATEFLETYYLDMLDKPQVILILDIVKDGMKLCIAKIAQVFEISKQSVSIRLQECKLL